MISLGMYLWRLAKGLFRWSTAQPTDAMVITAIVIINAGYIGFLRADRADLQAQLETQRSANTAAQAEAKAKADAARIKTEAASAANARKADREETAPVAGQRLAADRYAAARRLRAEAPCRVSGNPDARAEDGTAPHRDGPGPDAVVIPRADFDQLRDNTLRLERVRLWGESEIEAGRAVKVGD